MQQHVVAGGDEQQEQQVAGEHVAEQPQAQRERPGHVVRDELEDEDERQDRLGQAAGDHRLEVAREAVLAEADDVVNDVDDQGQRHREPDAAHRRVLDRRDDPEEVVDEDQGEHREEQRHELEEVVAADDVLGDRVAHQPVDLLGDPLPLARDDGRLARRGHQPPRDQAHGKEQDQRGPGERPRVVVATPQGPPELCRCRRLVAVAAARGGQRAQCGQHVRTHGISSIGCSFRLAHEPGRVTPTGVQVALQ